MGLKHSEFWNTDNVKTFRGYDVTNGEVDLTTEEFIDYLDEIYEPITLCGMSYSQGTALEAVDPVAFRCAQGDHESALQTELEAQLANEDDDDIEWHDDDLDEDEEVEDE